MTATDPVTLWNRTGLLAFTPDQFCRKGCLILIFLAWCSVPFFEGKREYGEFNGKPPITQSRESYDYGKLPNLLLCCDPARNVSFAYATIRVTELEEELENGENRADALQQQILKIPEWKTPKVLRTWFSNVHNWTIPDPWKEADMCIKFYTGSLVPNFTGKDKAFSTSKTPRIYLDVTFEDHGLRPDISTDLEDIWGGLDFWSEFADGGKQFLSTVPSWGASDQGVWKGKLAVYSMEKKRDTTLKYGSMASRGLSWRTLTTAQNEKETKETLAVIALNNRLPIARPKVPSDKPDTYVLPDLSETICKMRPDEDFCKVPVEPEMALSKLPSESPDLRVVKVVLQATKKTVTEVEQESPRQRLWRYVSSVGGLWSFLGILFGAFFTRQNTITPPTDEETKKIEADMTKYEEMGLRWNGVFSSGPCPGR